MNVILIALRNLFGEKGRLIITGGGVAFSVTLILVLLGLYQGWQSQLTRFFAHMDADYWVSQVGAKDMSHSFSLLPRTLSEKLASYQSVKSVTSFIGRQVGFEINGTDAKFYLLGEDAKKVISPNNIIKGRDTNSEGEIVVDYSFAIKHTIKVGDEINIEGKKIKVVGINKGGDVLVYSYALARVEDVREIIKANDFDNYLLIKTNDPNFKSRFEKDFPDLQIRSKQEVLDNNADLVKSTFLPIIGVLLLVAIATGIAVIGLTIFTATIEKGREYGVLKAIGYSSYQLFLIAFIQALVAGVLGLLVGYLLAPILTTLAQNYAPGILYEVGTKDMILVAVATLIMSILASFIPLRRLASIDPANVFKA